MKVSGVIQNIKLTFVALLLMFFWANTGFAQDTEPRRWSHMPTGVNFFGVGYAYVDGTIFFDPLLQIKDATFYMHRANLVYMRTFGVLGKSARLDFTLPLFRRPLGRLTER